MRVKVTTSQVAQYVLLPGIFPRVKGLFDSPFAFLASLFAMCFAMVRILPNNHRYLHPLSYGHYGVLDVIRAAASEVKFDLKHIDQVIMFFALLTGWVMCLLFLGMSLVYALMTPAHATMATDTGGLMATIFNYTNTPNPDKDIALMMLDRTLGITGDTASGTFFGSTVNTMCTGMDLGAANCTTVPAWPTPYHRGIHALLGFYSFAILCFAAILFLYFVFIIVFETTLTGVPFGTRFNRFWGPIRMVTALGLLMPLGAEGLNSAQYIVLYTAKISSAFATNGWAYYNQFILGNMTATSNNPIGLADYTWSPLYDPSIPNTSPLAAKINAPNLGDLVRFLHIMTSCEYYYERQSGKNTSGYPNMNIRGYFVRTGRPAVPAYAEPVDGGGVTAPSYADALTYFENGTIRVVFGHLDTVKYASLTSGVLPLCGEMAIPVTSLNNTATATIDNPGAARVNEYYYMYILALLDKTGMYRDQMDAFASQMVERYAKMDNQNGCILDTDNDNIINGPTSGSNYAELGDCHDDPPISYLYGQIAGFQGIFQSLVDASNAELANPDNFAISTQILNRGWAGAGIWYNRIATLNGNFISSVQQIPYGLRLPEPMENISALVSMSTANVQNASKFVNLERGQKNPLRSEDKPAAEALGRIYSYLYSDSTQFSFRPSASGPAGPSGTNGYFLQQRAKQDNPILDVANIILGSQFLFDFKDNQNTHPLAQLVSLGRTFLEKSARNLMTGSAISSLAGIISVGNNDVASGLKGTSQIFMAMASIFFMAGFTLYYILPMLPFVYFFFAMLSWVKAIFEALIGAPLWALAHLRLHGEGLPGSKAVGGYLLLMEIFVRPIITVFSLIGAIGIFTGTVYMINDLWDVVTQNVGSTDSIDIGTGAGYQPLETIRSPLDRMFFSIVYIVFVYMIANSSFKLIDRIPNSFMRWFGGGLKSFSAAAYNRDNPADTFTMNANVALAYPANNVIGMIDDYAYAGSAAIAHAVDNPMKTSESQFGGLAKSIQSIVGVDRGTYVSQQINRFATNQKSALEEAEELTQQLSKTKDPVARSQIEAEIKQKKIVAEANDPAMIADLIYNPNKAQMSPEARSLAQSSQNVDKMRDVISAAVSLKQDYGAGDNLVMQTIQATKNALNKDKKK